VGGRDQAGGGTPAGEGPDRGAPLGGQNGAAGGHAPAGRG
jgi:hypothetical protein